MNHRMAPRIIRESDVVPTDVSPALCVRGLINQADFPFSVARITVTGANEPTSNPHCDTTYYVLSGRGRFIIGGVEHQVEPGCLIPIPRETLYQDFGEPTLGLLAISWPRFPGNLD